MGFKESGTSSHDGGRGYIPTKEFTDLKIKFSGVDTIVSGVRPTSIGVSMWKRIS